MKTILLCTLLCSLIAAGCGSEKPETQTGTTQVANTYPTELARAAAQTLVKDFSTELKGELLSAIKEHEVVGAITVCQTVAPRVADSLSLEGWTIGRVSAKNRNPRNRATAEELEVLATFADTGATPPEYQEIWDTSDSIVVYRYYQPITTAPLCLKCHGDMQTLAPGVLTAVREAYPGDKATGYSSGELRGMFVVSARWPEAEDMAKRLAPGQIAP
jgi:hypothetical protein